VVLRSNVGKAGLGDKAELLAEISDDATTGRPENEPLH